LSTGKRGRRGNSRRATTRASSRKSISRLNIFLGLAGLGTTAITAGSTIAGAHTTVVVNIADDNSQSPEISAAARNPIRISVLSRVRAASRSEVRTSNHAAAELNAAATAPTLSQQTSSVLSTSDRQTLRAFASDSSALTAIVSDTQQEIDDQIAAQAAAKKSAIDVAKAAAKAAAANANNSANGNDATYPTNVGSAPARYDAPTPTQEQLANRASPIIGAYQLSARFGERGYHWSTGWHTGLDFVVRTGTAVHAAARGAIIFAGWAGPYGNRIEIDCGNGYIVTYNHLSKIEKTSGVVELGDEIARSGATGNVTGPHVHFEVLYNGAFINPAVWLWGASH